MYRILFKAFVTYCKEYFSALFLPDVPKAHLSFCYLLHIFFGAFVTYYCTFLLLLIVIFERALHVFK